MFALSLIVIVAPFGLALFCAPPTTLSRRSRKVEFKDLTAEVAAALKEITGGIAALGDRLKTCEGGAGEIKSLDKAVQAMAADLAELKKATPEMKGLDGRFAATAKQLEEVERKINRAVVEAGSGGKKIKKSFKSLDKLDAAMRAGGDVRQEVKELDSDLKTQDIFHDDVVTLDFPLIDLAYRRPTNSDLPKFSYPTGATVIIKGAGGAVSNIRKKVELPVLIHEYQPTLDSDDVQDVGAWLLDDEMQNMAEGTRECLAAALVDAVEAKGHDVGGIDQYVDVLQMDTAANTGYTAEDLDTLIATLGVKYLQGAVFVGNAGMSGNLRAIVDNVTGVSLWQPSLAAGIPPTLKGYRYIQDANVAANRLLFGNPRRGLAIGERQAPQLLNMERLGGDYKPYFWARYARGVYDPRAWKIMDLKL